MNVVLCEWNSGDAFTCNCGVEKILASRIKVIQHMVHERKFTTLLFAYIDYDQRYLSGVYTIYIIRIPVDVNIIA